MKVSIDHIAIRIDKEDLVIFKSMGYEVCSTFYVDREIMAKLFDIDCDAEVMRLHKEGEPAIEAFIIENAGNKRLDHIALHTDDPQKMTELFKENGFDIVDVDRKTHITFFARKGAIILEYKKSADI